MPRPSLQLSDNQFLEGLRVGDNEVLEALYKKYYNIVLKLVVSNSGTSDEARDIYQESIIVLYENARKPGFILNCQLQTYIYSVARRLWLKQLKKNSGTYLIREEDESVLADVSGDVEHHVKRESEYEKVEKGLESLGEPCATLIRDFYVKKLSMDDIAEKFGYTNADNAKNQKYKCLQRLKKHFFDKPAAEPSETERL
jgi:RNA polymerase sigma factor (sigma-70 family)